MPEPENMEDSGALQLAAKLSITALASALVFAFLVFVAALLLCGRRIWNRRREASPVTMDNPNLLDFSGNYLDLPAVPATSIGLDPSVLKSLPVRFFDPKVTRIDSECAVCLSEFKKGEKTRILPVCNHGFHLECIDMWFHSHSTCPLCRNPISNQNLVPSPGLESFPNIPTNVLIWGDENQVIALDHAAEPSSSATSPAPTADTIGGSRIMNEEDQETKSPLPIRIMNLKKLLDRKRREIEPSGPRNVDLEAGTRE